MICPLTTGSFNDTDLQGIQVLVPAVIRAKGGLLDVSRQRSTSRTEQRMRSPRNPLGIISTPLRYPLRPRPNNGNQMANASKPGILNTHSASIVFTKAITKKPRGTTEDSKPLKRVTSNMSETGVAKERFPLNPFLTNAGDGSESNKEGSASQLVSELSTRLKKPMNQSWDMKVSGENSTHNVTEDGELDSSFEMSSILPESQDVLTEEVGDAGLGTFYSLEQSIPSALSSSQRVISHRSSGLLNTVEIQLQTPSLVLYPTIKPTPTVSVHKVSVQTTVVSHGHLLYGSLWTATSSSNQMGNPLNTLNVLLRDQLNTETTAPSFHDNIESSIDPHELTFHTRHSGIKSSSTALPKDNSNVLSSWPPSFLSPERVASDDAKSIISSTAVERDERSFIVTRLTLATDLLHLTNHFGKDSVAATQRLFISTEKLENQLRQSEDFTLFPGQMSVRGQGDGISVLAQSTHMDSLDTSAKSHSNLNQPDALTSVSSAPPASDGVNIPSTPDNFWGNSLTPSTSELNEGVTRFHRVTETSSVSQRPLDFHIHPSISGTVQSANVNAIVLQPGTQTHIKVNSASVARRVSESPLAQASRFAPLKVSSVSIDSQWRLSAKATQSRATIPHLPVSKKLTDKHHYQVSLTDITPHMTQSYQRASFVTESKWKTLAPNGTGSVTKDNGGSLVPLHISSNLTSDTLHSKNDSSAVADNLMSSLETSTVNVGSTWTVPLEWIPEVTDMLLQSVSSDVYASVRSENATSLSLDDPSEMEQIPTLIPNSSHGSMNGADFPSFLLTVPEGFQNHWEIISQANNSSTVASGSHTQEKSVTPAIQSEKKVQLENQLTKVSADTMWNSLLGFIPDRTGSLVAYTAGSPGLKWEAFSNSVLERSKDLVVVTSIPVHLEAQWTLLSTHTPSLTKSPQLVNSDGIFTGAQPERTSVNSFVQPPKDAQTIVLNITLTSQKHARTLQHPKPEQFDRNHYTEEPHKDNQGLQSIPFSISPQVSEGMSGGFTSTFIGTPQPSAAIQELILVPTLPMGSSAAFSINAPSAQSTWGIVTSTETNTLLDLPLQSSQPSTTHPSSLQPLFSSTTVAPPPVPSRDVHGLNVASSTSLESGKPPAAIGQASVPCLCEEVDGTGCLCGVMVANRMS